MVSFFPQNAKPSDSGKYTCKPAQLEQASVNLHVLECKIFSSFNSRLQTCKESAERTLDIYVMKCVDCQVPCHLDVSPVQWLGNSTLDLQVVGSNLVSSNILDGNGVITMPELISVPNSGSIENKENTGSQMGHTNKKIFLKNRCPVILWWHFCKSTK